MRYGMRRRAVVAGIVVVAVAALPGVPARASTGSKPVPLVGGYYQHIQAAGTVNVRELDGRRAASSVPLPNHAVVRHAKPWGTPPTLTLAPEGGGSLPRLTTQGTVEELLTVFPGIDLATAQSALGPGQNAEPPDTQIAAGPDKLVEMVNNNMTTWSKSGTRLSLTDLKTFWSVPTGFSVTDPRVLFDAGSGRFIAVIFAMDNAFDSKIYLAVSQTSDPDGLWSRWVLKSTTRVITDQPKVGVSDDKVAVSWAEGVPPPCQGQSAQICFTGEVTFVVQKSDVLAVPQMGQPRSFVVGPDPTRFGIVPAQSMTSTTTQYLVYNNADPYFAVENHCAPPTTPVLYWNCPTLGIIAVTGTPAAGNVAWSEADPAVNDTTAPPNATQSGTAVQIDTDDDRLLSAVYQNNRLWTSAGDGNDCSVHKPTTTPAGACIVVLAAATDQAGFPVLMMTHLGTASDYIYYPAIGLDLVGDAFLAFSRSNSSMSPSALVTGEVGLGTPWTGYVALTAGAGKYDTQTSCGGHNRWGDYSGAAVDPADPTDVWVAAEYAFSATNSCLWGTSIARLTYSAPTVTSVTPQKGSAGTSTVITGTDFVAGATTVYFGSTPATGVSVQTPDQLTATAPSGSGLVPLSASTADGQGPQGVSFKYPRTEGAPVSVGSLPGAVARGGAPPIVPQKAAGTRPLIQSNSHSPSGGEQGGGLTQPVQRSRLRLL